MKKLLIALSLVLALLLCACGASAPAETTAATTTPETTADTTPATEAVPETEPTETVPETEPEPTYPPEMGLVVEGTDNVLTEPVLICEQDGVKVTLTNSVLGVEGDEYFYFNYWEPTFVIENTSDVAATVAFETPYGGELTEWFEFPFGNVISDLDAGETTEYTTHVMHITQDPVTQNAHFSKKYADFEEIPVYVSINDAEYKMTMLGLTVGGPYEDEPEVDYTGMFGVEIAGEPYIRQTSKGPDYFTYAVDVVFTNNSDTTVVVDWQTVAPGESVTVRSDIAFESESQDELDPHQTYAVSVYDENNVFLTKVTIDY